MNDLLSSIKAVLPPEIVIAQGLDEDLIGHESEAAALRPDAAPKRQAEFFLGRLAAQRALALLAIDASFPIPATDRIPDWPDGCRGSITHKNSLALCCVGPASRYTAIGIDLEAHPIELVPGIASRICTPDELLLLPNGGPSRSLRTIQIFSAKEAFYKALPRTQQQDTGFRDVELRLLNGWKLLECRRHDGSGPPIEVRSLCTGGWIFSLAFASQPARPS